MNKEAIKWYKKRIAAGGWFEEIWFSYYSIGDLHKRMGNIIKFEEWMLRAFEFRKERAESIYKLAEHFRIVGQHYKSYHYIKLGINIPYPLHDALFIESNVYNGLFHYEASIIEYYVLPDKIQGVRSSVKALLAMTHLRDNIISNLQYYVKPIKSTLEQLVLEDVFSDKYRPSAISLDTYPFANVRFVNYWMENGDYKTNNGEDVDTQNAYMNLETGKCITKMKDDVGMVKYPTNVKGLEDVRLYQEEGLHFTATSVREYTEHRVCTMHGDYNKETGEYSNVYAVRSPFNRECEKNWCAIPETGLFIYEWFPLNVGKIIGNNFISAIKHATPNIFRLFRGSAPTRIHNNSLWALVHFTECSKPRKYYHCFVELELKTYMPKRMTLPFVFKSVGVEYCLSFDFKDDTTIRCYTSFMDSNPAIVEFKTDDLEWISI
jgi:hypothetical protein